MNGWAKFCIGGFASALLGWGYHSAGGGEGFIGQLSARTEAAIGDAPVTVEFGSKDTLSRIATLSGAIPLAERDAIKAKVKAVSGVAAVRWAEDTDGAAASISNRDIAADGEEIAGTAASEAGDAQTDDAAQSQIAAPPATSAAISKCQGKIDALLESRNITFRSGSAYLSGSSQKLLDDLAAVLKPCAGTNVEISGHTDASGSKAINQSISTERANRVRAALVERGIAETRLSAKGYGAAKPRIANNPSAAGNRRIDFSITSTASAQGGR